MENTLKTLYNRRHSARQLSDFSSERASVTGGTAARNMGLASSVSGSTSSGTITPFSSEGSITPTPMPSTTAASLRISTTATTPLLSHQRTSSLASSLESLQSLSQSSTVTTSNNTNHSAHSSLSSTDFSSTTSSSSCSISTSTAYPSPSYTAHLNTPKTSFSTNTSLSTTSSYSNNSSVPNTAYSSLSSASFPLNTNTREKPIFTHFDFLSSAAPSSSSNTAISNTNSSVVSRPPLLRSVSEDVVVNHRTEFPLPGIHKYIPTTTKGGGGGALPLTSNGRAFTTGSIAGKANTRYRTQTVNSPLRSGASLDTDNDSKSNETGSTPLSTDNQSPNRSRTQSAVITITKTVGNDQQSSGNSMFDSYYGFEEHRRANTTGGSGYMTSLASASSQTQTERRHAGDYDRHAVDSFHLPSNFDQATAEAVRRAAAFVRSTTGGGIARSTSPPPPPHSEGQHFEERHHHARFQQHVQSSASMNNYAGIMGSCGNGYFGNAIRSKVGIDLSTHIQG